jgi:predicted nucleotidyltransferase
MDFWRPNIKKSVEVLGITDMERERLLENLSVELAQVLGDKLEQILLYGSHARGEAHHGSDLDILIVIRGDFDYASLIRQTSELIARLSLENDVVISRAFTSQERLENERSPFTLNVQREGIPI